MVARTQGLSRVYIAAGLEKLAVHPRLLFDNLPSGVGDVMDRLGRHLKDNVDMYPLHRRPLSSRLGDFPLSSAMKKQYPKAPNMARRLQEAEEAILNSAGDARSRIENSIVRPRSGEGMFAGSSWATGDWVSPKRVGDEWPDELSKDTGRLSLSRLSPSVYAHEGRHALQFVPGESDPTVLSDVSFSGFFGAPRVEQQRVPARSVTGLTPDQLGDTLTIERDANRFAENQLRGIPFEESALTGAAQGTYEAGINEALMAKLEDLDREMPRGDITFQDLNPMPRSLASRTKRRQELRRNMEKELDAIVKGVDLGDGYPVYDYADFQRKKQNLLSRQEIAQSILEANPASSYGQELLEEAQAGMEALKKLQLPESAQRKMTLLSNLGDMTGRTYDLPFPNPLEARYWEAATPEIARYQQARHQAVVDTLREALGPKNAAIYDAYVKQNIARVDPRGAFLNPDVLRAPEPPTLVDRVRGALSRSDSPAPIGPVPEPDQPGRLARARDYVTQQLRRLRSTPEAVEG